MVPEKYCKISNHMLNFLKGSAPNTHKLQSENEK